MPRTDGDGKVNLDGMNINYAGGSNGGQSLIYCPNMVAVQEVVIDTGGQPGRERDGRRQSEHRAARRRQYVQPVRDGQLHQ
jgi:hypothetical protein